MPQNTFDVKIVSSNDTVRQRVITWTDAGPDLGRHMASLGYNESMICMKSNQMKSTVNQ